MPASLAQEKLPSKKDPISEGDLEACDILGSLKYNARFTNTSKPNPNKRAYPASFKPNLFETFFPPVEKKALFAGAHNKKYFGPSLNNPCPPEMIDEYNRLNTAILQWNAYEISRYIKEGKEPNHYSSD